MRSAGIMVIVVATLSVAPGQAAGSDTPSWPTLEPLRSSLAATATPARRSALTLLGTLRVKGRAPRTGYDRARFGQRWADVDRNGCDTRNDTLRRDLRSITLKAGTSECVVLRGTLLDPYTGRSLRFVRGGPSETDIDHVVALSDAWQKGAQAWTEARRTALANDPLNLLAVDASANRQKGDADAASWLPPNKGFRCRYVARQIAVKAEYGLWITHAEGDQMRRVLARCPNAPSPDPTRAPVITAPPSAPPTPPSPPSTPAPGLVRFPNCDAARAAGEAPILRGTPLYALNGHLDGDDDGVACEG